MLHDHSTRQIASVTFDPHVYRTGHTGDNWCQTWAGDDHVYTSMDDGTGWRRDGRRYNNHVFRLAGGPEPFTAHRLDGYPDYPFPNEWYGYGILAADGVIYHFITCASRRCFGAPFRGAKLIYSPDCGETWMRHDGVDAHQSPMSKDRSAMFFWREIEGYPFSNIAFLQAGRDYTDARDDYVYLYSPGGWGREHQLLMARVPRDRVLDREVYEFFVGRDGDKVARWSRHITEAGPVHTYPTGYGWYSWLPSVVYNKPLDLYLMVSGGTGRGGTEFHDRLPSLGIYWACRPWGPWHACYYNDNWYSDDPGNRQYQPKLSPKWISDDGRELVLVYSDARDGWTTNYHWNQQRLILESA
ncbi:MAG: DUF4185 domain-containing protein [Phycisphaeraceae bacterium]